MSAETENGASPRCRGDRDCPNTFDPDSGEDHCVTCGNCWKHCADIEGHTATYIADYPMEPHLVQEILDDLRQVAYAIRDEDHDGSQ
jgi:predicted molibdopterin-dependent oxidoreductase YjgC